MFLNVPLHIMWYQFITLQVTLPILSPCVPLNGILVFKHLGSNLLNIVILWTLRVIPGGHPKGPRNFGTIFRLRLSKVNITRHKNVVVPIIHDISKQNNSQLIHQHFGRVSISIWQLMSKKFIMKGLPKNLPDLEEPWPIRLFTKATKIPIGPNNNVSNIVPVFMLQMNITFFNVESISGFTSNFVSIWSATSQPFCFLSIIKTLLIYIIKFKVNTLRKKDNKFAFVWVYKYVSQKLYLEFMRAWHNMNIIVQTTGRDSYYHDVKSWTSNKILSNITRVLMVSFICNK